MLSRLSGWALSLQLADSLHPVIICHMTSASPADEWAELPEWVEHHMQVGVGKMYILDDGSQVSAALLSLCSAAHTKPRCASRAATRNCAPLLPFQRALPPTLHHCALLCPRCTPCSHP